MIKKTFRSIYLALLLFVSCEDNLVDPPVVNEDKIIFISSSDIDDSNSDHSIHSININGSELKQLTITAGYITEPVVTYDGEKVLFVSDGNGWPDIFSINVDGSNKVNLTNSPSLYYNPEVSA